MDRNEKEIQCIGPKPFRKNKNKNKTNKKRKKNNPFLEVKMRTQLIHPFKSYITPKLSDFNLKKK